MPTSLAVPGRKFIPSAPLPHNDKPSRKLSSSLALFGGLALATCNPIESTGSGGAGGANTSTTATDTITVPCATELDHPLTQEKALTYCEDIKVYLAKHPECNTAITEVCFGISSKLMSCGIGNAIFCNDQDIAGAVNAVYDNGGSCSPAFVQIADASCP